MKRFVLLVYGLGVAGAFLQIAGANWDVSSHILGIVDTFFTPPHLVLYLGILLVLIAGILGMWRLRRVEDEDMRLPVLGVKIAFSGIIIQIVAGPLDFLWHSLYGFDPYLFTPTHSMLIIGLALGGLGMSVGVLGLLRTSGTKFLKFLAVLSLGTLWLDINFFVLWLSNAHGIAYTFGICSPGSISAQTCSFVDIFGRIIYLPALFLDALGGTVVILLAKRWLGWRGALTSVASIVVAVNAVANLGFSAYMVLFVGVPGSFYFTPTAKDGAAIVSIILPYVALVVPVAVFDLLVSQNGRRVILASLISGPLSVFLDGRFSIFSGLWSFDPANPLTPVYFLTMLSAGVLAGWLRLKLIDAPLHVKFESGRPAPQAPQL
jgi:hypothetical protein